MEEDLYKILNISENSSIDEIKKSYRKLSLIHHPDKPGGNEETFKKISNAYSILSDPQKKQDYDFNRTNPFTRQHSMGGFNGGVHGFHEDIIQQMFGGGGGLGGGIFNMMHGGGSMGMGPNVRVFHNGVPINIGSNGSINIGGGMNMGGMFIEKPPHILKTIQIPFEKIISDFVEPIEIERWFIENGNKIFETEVIYVPIPKGIDTNEVIILKNKGNYVNDNRSDVKITIVVINNTEFKRDGVNLIYNKQISLKEALTGFCFELKHINGKTYTLNNNEGNVIIPNYHKTIENLGLSRENYVGSLIVIFDIIFPSELSPEVIEKLKDVL